MLGGRAVLESPSILQSQQPLKTLGGLIEDGPRGLLSLAGKNFSLGRKKFFRTFPTGFVLDH